MSEQRHHQRNAGAAPNAVRCDWQSAPPRHDPVPPTPRPGPLLAWPMWRWSWWWNPQWRRRWQRLWHPPPTRLLAPPSPAAVVSTMAVVPVTAHPLAQRNRPQSSNVLRTGTTATRMVATSTTTTPAALAPAPANSTNALPREPTQ